MWSWLPGEENHGFWARRLAHETLVHRADACLTARLPFEASTETATDAIQERLEIVGHPQVRAEAPELRALRDRAGASLLLEAAADRKGAGTRWLVSLTADGIVQRRAPHTEAAPADLVLRAPVAELLLVPLRRRPPGDKGVEVRGDTTLLDLWQACARFG